MKKPDLQAVAKQCGISAELPQELLDFYASWKETEGAACSFAIIDSLQQEHRLFGEFYELVRQAAVEVNENTAYSLWVKVTASYVLQMPEALMREIPAPTRDGSLALDFLPLFVMLPRIPVSIADYRRRGFSEEELADLLPAYAGSIGLVQRQSGRPGLDRIYFRWMSHFLYAQIFKCNGFQFHPYGAPNNTVFLKNKQTGELLPLAIKGTFHKSGLRLLGKPGYEDEEGSFQVSFDEDSENYYGYQAVDGAICSKKSVLPKAIWEACLVPGDTCLFIHIPSGTDISKENLMAACERAKNFARVRYPGEAKDIIFCCSWLLNPVLQTILGENSRIVAFQRQFTCRPNGGDDGSDVYRFVFHRQDNNIAQFPEDTSLQRKIKAMYLQGQRLYLYDGIL